MNNPRKTSFDLQNVAIIAIFAIGILLSVFSYNIIRNFEQLYISQEFESAASNHFIELQTGLDNNFFALNSIGDFFNSSKNISRTQFKSFTQSILSHYKTFHALEWVPRVFDSQRDAYVQLAQKDGFESFEITEKGAPNLLVRAKEREEYFPVFYVEPYKGNELDLGYDLASDQARFEAMTKAKESGEISASSRISFIQDTSNEYGFVIFLPVYNVEDAKRLSVTKRSEKLIGFLTGVFRIDRMIKNSMTYSSQYKVDIHIFDESAQAREDFLFSTLHKSEKDGKALDISKSFLQKGLYLTKSLDVGGRRWLVVLTPKEEYIASLRSRWQPALILVGGLILTCLLTVYLLQMNITTQKLKKEIYNHQQTELQLRKSREELQNLSAYLQDVREEERKSIAREIHDELGQALTALRMDLKWIDQKITGQHKDVSDKAAAMTKLIDSTIKSVQRISSELRPGVLDDLGLVAALEWQITEFEKRMGISTKITITPKEIDLNQAYSTTIFRLVQETLTNVARHAKATEVKVDLKKESDAILLEVSDNGRGISEKEIERSDSFGLIGMRERVRHLSGEIDITGEKGKGTKVAISLPLDGSKNIVK